jgi:hypothetical protein
VESKEVISKAGAYGTIQTKKTERHTVFYNGS